MVTCCIDPITHRTLADLQAAGRKTGVERIKNLQMVQDVKGSCGISLGVQGTHLKTTA